jgi:integrase
MAIVKRAAKDGRSRYLVRIAAYDPVTGKRQNKNIGTFRTKAEAQAKEREALTERDRGTLVDPKRLTMSDLLDIYLAQEMPKTVKPENQQEYRIVVEKHLKPALGHLKVQKLTAEHVDAFYGALLAKEYSSSLIRKCHQRLSTALRMAVRWQIVSRNVAETVSPPKMNAKPPKVWTPQEAARFLAVAREAQEPLLPYWNLMLETGARTSELLGVSWNDVDFERGTIRLGAQVVRLLGGTPVVKVGGKTESAMRTIRLTVPTLEMLQDYRRLWLAARVAAEEWADAHELIFVSRTGRPLNARNVRRAFDRVVQLAAVPSISPHGIRKTHITASIAAGAPVKAVAARVGHRDVSTTLRTYTALTRGQEDQLMHIVEALMAVPAECVPASVGDIGSPADTHGKD